MMINKINSITSTSQHSLQGKTITAALWSLAGSGGSGAIRFASNLILTRLLFPEAFGLMSSAMVVITLIQVFSDTGIKTALIQNSHGGSPDYVNTSFIIAIIRSMVLFVLIVLAIEPVVQFYDEQKLRPLLWIMSFALLTEGFINPALPLLIKKLQMQKQVIYATSSQFAGFISTVVLVYFFRDVTAVAIGYLLTSLYRIGASYLVINFRPKLSWNTQAGKDLLHFGKYILINTIVTWAVMNLDRLVIGKTLDMQQLGYYNIALYLGLFISNVLGQIFYQSYFPALSSVADQTQKVQHIYRKTMVIAISFAIPALILIALFSDNIIRLLYDPRYQSASVVLFWIALKSIFSVLANIQSGTLLALGKPVYVTISMAVGFLPLSIILPKISIKYGLGGSGSVVFITGILIALVQTYFLIKKMGFGYGTVFIPWIRATILSISIVTTYFLLKPYVSYQQFHNLPFIALMSITALGVAVLSMWKSGASFYKLSTQGSLAK